MPLLQHRNFRLPLLLLQHHNLEKTLAQGLEQITAYLDRVGEASGHLVIFDCRNQPWEEKIYRREERCGTGSV